MESQLDNGENVGAILMDLSNAFNCIKHDLQVAKPHAYSLTARPCPLGESIHIIFVERPRLPGYQDGNVNKCTILFQICLKIYLSEIGHSLLK